MSSSDEDASCEESSQGAEGDSEGQRERVAGCIMLAMERSSDSIEFVMAKGRRTSEHDTVDERCAADRTLDDVGCGEISVVHHDQNNEEKKNEEKNYNEEEESVVSGELSRSIDLPMSVDLPFPNSEVGQERGSISITSAAHDELSEADSMHSGRPYNDAEDDRPRIPGSAFFQNKGGGSNRQRLETTIGKVLEDIPQFSLGAGNLSPHYPFLHCTAQAQHFEEAKINEHLHIESEAVRQLMLGSNCAFDDQEEASFAIGSDVNENSHTLLQVPPMDVMVQNIQYTREVPVMGSQCMLDEPRFEGAITWRGRGLELRGRGFQSSLHSMPVQVPQLQLGQAPSGINSNMVNRVITFHELFATGNDAENIHTMSQTGSPSPILRTFRRGLLSRGNTLSQTPMIVRKRLLTTPRAQTAREYEGGYDVFVTGHEKEKEFDFFNAGKPMSARADAADSRYKFLHKLAPNTLSLGDRLGGDARYLARDVLRPTTVGMASGRSTLMSRDSAYSNSTPRQTQVRTSSRSMSARNNHQRIRHDFSEALFGKTPYKNPYGECIGNTAVRTFLVDAADVGSSASGLFSIITPRKRDEAVLMHKSSPTTSIVTDRKILDCKLSESIQDTLKSRKLGLSPAISSRTGTAMEDHVRHQMHQQQWSRIERQMRNLWQPKLPPHAIEEITATNPKARQKLAMIRRFCEITALDDENEFMSLYCRFMSQSEVQEEGLQVCVCDFVLGGLL